VEIPVGTKVERYLIEGVIGAGGMAVVYLVRHRELGSQHALKVLTLPGRKAQSRLIQEGQLQSSLRHPNVASVTDIVRVQGAPALVMEYIRGPSLAELLAKCQLTLEQADAMARGILRGVAAAHVHGMIHRDLKPANILVDVEEGRLVPKITDFGLAKVAGRSGRDAQGTRTGDVMGTPAYMAPEQIRDSSSVDARADVFSLGAMLYELVTGQSAFGGGETMKVWARILAGNYQPPEEVRDDLPERMRRAIHGALAVDREARFADLPALIEAWGVHLDTDAGIRQVPDGASLWRGRALEVATSGRREHGPSPTLDMDAPEPASATPRTYELPVREAKAGAVDPTLAFFEAPTGTVTLVFTDIESSTRLWERLDDSFEPALALHDQILRDALQEHSGYEVQKTGDAFVLAFASASDAVRYCLDVQLRLHQADWPDALLNDKAAADLTRPSNDGAFRGIRVRMGIHTGEPLIRQEPVTGRLEYGGQMFNRAMRVGSAPHGGQVVLSQSTYQLVSEVLSSDTVGVVDLGEHALEGLERREHLWQVTPKAISPRRFPRLRTADLRQTNLTPQLSRFFGREKELAALATMLGEQRRLVTLLGPGGTGKTRTATRFGALHLLDYPGGVWWCDLTQTRTLEGICGAVASALGASLGTTNLVQDVGRLLAGMGRTLLLLDNFEQVVAHAADTVGSWLATAPKAVFVVTSRERLHIGGEQVLNIDPLPPGDAMRLFEDRARQVRADFRLTETNRPVVEQIVQRLDGLSLAIELAAARIAMLPPERILERLGQRFKVLRSRRRDRDARQATLQGAIDWSWDLLEPWEQLGLAQCSVFRGGFDLKAAESILDLEAWPDAPWAMDVVESLVNKSLLRVTEPTAGHERFNLYESIREYGRDKLEGATEICGPDGIGLSGPDAASAARLRHIDYYSGLGATSSTDSRDGNEDSLELDNFLATVAASLEAGCLDRAAGAVRAALRIFFCQGPIVAGLRFAETVLAATGLTAVDEASVELRRVDILLRLGQGEQAREISTRVLAVSRELGEPVLEAQALKTLGQICVAELRYDKAWEYLGQALGTAEACGATSVTSMVHLARGVIEHDRGNTVQAQAHYRASLDLLEHVADPHARALCLSNLALLSEQRGQLPEAIELYERALERSSAQGLRWAQTCQAINLAEALRIDGQVEACTQRLAENLELAGRIEAREFEGYGRVTQGRLHQAQGRLDEAEVGFKAALDLFRTVGDTRYEGFALTFLGDLYRRRGRLDDAEAVTVPGVRMLRDWGEPTFLGRGLSHLGLLRIAQGNPPAARELLREGEALIQQIECYPTADLSQCIEELRAALEG